MTWVYENKKLIGYHETQNGEVIISISTEAPYSWTVFHSEMGETAASGKGRSLCVAVVEAEISALKLLLQ